MEEAKQRERRAQESIAKYTERLVLKPDDPNFLSMLESSKKELSESKVAQMRSPVDEKRYNEAKERVSNSEGKYQGVVDNFVRAAKEGHQAEVERNLGILVDPYKREWGGGLVEDVDAPNTDGVTALHMASTHNRDLIVKYLLDHGANVLLTNRYGRSTLHNTAIYGHVATTKILLEAKADRNAQDAKGRSPLHEAALNAHEPLIDLLLPENDFSKTKRGWTAVDEAKSRGHHQLAQKILDAGVAAGRKAETLAVPAPDLPAGTRLFP